MKNILLWLHSKFPVRKSREEIYKMIDEHEAETTKASATVDKVIEAIHKASLDGEEGWWCKFVANQDKECNHADSDHNPT